MEMHAIMALQNTGEIRILIKTILQSFLALVVCQGVLVGQEQPRKFKICQADLCHFMCSPEKQHTMRGYFRNKVHNDKHCLRSNRNILLKYQEKRNILSGF